MLSLSLSLSLWLLSSLKVKLLSVSSSFHMQPVICHFQFSLPYPVHGEARQLTSSFCVNIHPWYSMQSIYIHHLMHGCTRLCICQFVVKAQLLCVCPSLRAQPIYHSYSQSAIHFDMLFTRNAPFDSSFFVNRSVNNIYSITSVKFICIAHLMQAALDAHLSPICSACNLQFTVFCPVIHTLLTQKRAHSLFIHSFYLL